PTAGPESSWQLGGSPLRYRRSQFDAASCNLQSGQLDPVNNVVDKSLKFEQHLADQRSRTFFLQRLGYPVPLQVRGPLKSAFQLEKAAFRWRSMLNIHQVINQHWREYQVAADRAATSHKNQG